MKGAGMFETILLAVDGSEYSERSLPVAAELALKFKSQVVVFHVREMDIGKGGPVPLEPTDEAIALVDRYVSKLAERGIKATPDARSEMFGRAARLILDAARERGAGIIVMGSRGFSDLTGLLLGSVAHKVIHHATCPVLVVR
jgi:nucleotide-binding universal stress UspA family protein